MKLNNKYILTAVLASTLGLSSCEDFLDINRSPNAPAVSSPALTLPAGLGELSYVLGNQFQILGNFYAQHWTQAGAASQYCDLEIYQMTSSDYDGRVWGEFYAGALNDFKYVADQGNATANPNYAAIGEIMQAYTMQIITDAWGDVPFFDALQGLGQLNAKYDSQEAIYAGLITLLDGAIAKIDNDARTPGADDLVFQGNMDQWRRFANTLKLRVYLRQAYVKPAVAEAGIKAMYAANAEFLGTGGNADINFVNATQNKNPFFQTNFEFLGGGNVIASNTALNYLSSTADPRVNAFYAPAETGANAGRIAGRDQGFECSPDGTTLTALNFSKPGPLPGSATSPVPFLTAAESYFLQAEAVARGWSNGAGNAAALYEQGVRASFAYAGKTDAQATAFLANATVAFPATGSVEAKVERIITQKWISFNGTQGFEAWTEYRRTGYPSFIEPSLAAQTGSKVPKRILYPNSEATSNTEYPGLKEIEVPVWWDVKD